MTSLHMSIPFPHTVVEYLKKLLESPQGKLLTPRTLVDLVDRSLNINYCNDIAVFQYLVIDIYISISKKRSQKWCNCKTVRKCEPALQKVIGYQYMPNSLISKLIWKYCIERGLTDGKFCIVDNALRAIFGENKVKVNPTQESYSNLSTQVLVDDVPECEWEKTEKYLKYCDLTKEYEELLKNEHSGLLKCNQILEDFLGIPYCTIKTAVDMVIDYAYSKRLVRNGILHPNESFSTLFAVFPIPLPINSIAVQLSKMLIKFDIKKLPMQQMYNIAQLMEHRKNHLFPLSLVRKEIPIRMKRKRREKSNKRTLHEWDETTELLTNFKFMPQGFCN
eukprot:NODE_56_length_25944_cov_0.235287.p8 type:complete len:334 gc:universal NODE_56_length_25944_cov_0.235287:25794-24793(-)